MVADYSFDVKNIDIWSPAFFRHNNSSIATADFVVPGMVFLSRFLAFTWYLLYFLGFF